MQINTYYNQSTSPQFTSTRECVRDSLGRVINCHYSDFNRKDMDWGKFAQMLLSRFDGKAENIKINLFGCSDASDVYTLLLHLKKVLGKDFSKLPTIKASDISAQMIQKAKNGEILLHERDLQFLDSLDARQYFIRDYSKPIEQMRGIDFYPYKVSPELTKHVEFSVKDIRNEAKNYNFSNEVFIFRNGWTFMDLNNQNEVTKNLSKNSNKKTLCAIGQSDLFKSNASEFFQRNGFKGIESDVFAAGETNYPSVSIGMPAEKSTYPEFILFEKM